MTRARHSISRRLTAWLLVGIGLLLLITGIVLDRVVAFRLQAEYDQALLAKARALVALTDQDQDGVELDFVDDVMPEFHSEQEPEYFQVWLEDGEVLARSNSTAERDLPRLAGRHNAPRFIDWVLPDGRSGRRVQIDFLPHLDTEEGEDDDEPAAPHPDLVAEQLSLVVAGERERLDDLLNTLHLTFLAAGLAAMGLIVLLVRLAVRISLRPLAEIRTQVAGFDANSLDARLRPNERTEELESVVEQFNAMLDRVQAAFERERQFSADVAHELRTPLAEMRSLAEVGGRWPDDPELAGDFFFEVLGATRQMERIVVNLLALARCEKGLEVVNPSQVDVAAAINRAWLRIAPEAEAKQITLQRQVPATVRVYTGRDQLDLILNNLFSNAVAYSPRGSEVVCTVDDNGGGLKLSVANRADHLNDDDLPHLFERLWRKDPARSSGHHAGLGLSLVKAYAAQLKLSLDVALEQNRIFRITLIGEMPIPATVTTT